MTRDVAQRLALVFAAFRLQQIQAAGKAAQQDEVVISEAGQSFSDMLQKLRSGDEVRQEKVDAYTQAIESGTYHVDAKDIAAKMLGLMM